MRGIFYSWRRKTFLRSFAYNIREFTGNFCHFCPKNQFCTAPKARITDYSKQLYELKVSCKYLRDIFEKDKDVKNLNNAVAASQYAHCRIGLARKFLMQENHCYLMLNGLFLY